MWGAVSAVEQRPATSKAVVLKVEVSDEQTEDNLTKGIRSLYTEEALCDVMLVAGGQSFPAHQAALASSSPGLREKLRQAITEARAAEAVAAAAAEAKAAEAAANATTEVAPSTTSEPAAEAPLASAPPTETPPPLPTSSTVPSPSVAPPPLPATAQTAAGEIPVEASTPVESGEIPAQAAATAESVPDPDVPSPPKVLEVRFPDISSPEAIQIMLAHIYGTDGGEVANYSPSSDEANKDVLRLASQLQLDSLKEFATHWMASNLNSSNAVPRLSTCQEFALHDLFEAATESLAGDAFALGQVTDDIDIIKHPRLLQKLLIRVASIYPKSSKRDRTMDSAPDLRHSKKSRSFVTAEGGA